MVPAEMPVPAPHPAEKFQRLGCVAKYFVI
jgi:hypothetical protein